ncbi:MAG TPA: glycerate kinase [Conexibacter sp.]|jgi:glycerate kinase
MPTASAVRVLCAPDKLRGALDAPAAARALAVGVRAAGGLPSELPIADGGEGTLDALAASARGESTRRGPAGVGPSVPGMGAIEAIDVHDALGGSRRARLAELAPGRFLVEAAEAIPLAALHAEERDVERASSAGVGELIAAALDRRARSLLIAVGGTATVDGGAGALRALGARCAHDGAGLLADQSVDVSTVDARLAGVELTLLVDVDAPLTGPDGAAARFGPQKGATPAQVVAFDEALGRWGAALGIDPNASGAGAAGGLGAALQALGARTVAGADAVLDLCGFDALLRDADLCVTAEGSVDASTLQGKAVAAVVARCVATGVPVVVLGGRVDPAAAAELRRRGARDVRPLGPSTRPLPEALAAAAADLESAAAQATRERRAG